MALIGIHGIDLEDSWTRYLTAVRPLYKQDHPNARVAVPVGLNSCTQYRITITGMQMEYYQLEYSWTIRGP